MTAADADGIRLRQGQEHPGRQMLPRGQKLGQPRRRAALVGACAVPVLILLAALVPGLSGWDVRALSLPPLFAQFTPRLGPGTVPAVLIAAAVAVWGPRLATSLPWPALLGITTLTSAAWMLSLDAIDGWDHLGAVLDSPEEYLPTARALAADIAEEGPGPVVQALLSGYVDRIPLEAPNNLPVHLAGHPPGAVLFFALLITAGITSTYGIGLTVTALAATIPVAVALTLRSLGAESHARTLTPFLAAAPAAIWLAVSADALFAVVGAWAIVLLAVACAPTSPYSRPVRATAASAAGVLLGLGTFMSYGFPVLGFVALAVFWCGRSLRYLPWAVAGGVLVLTGVVLGGFHWWEAYPALSRRYWDGFASSRPAGYWLWANWAALACALGPAVGAGFAVVFAETGRTAAAGVRFGGQSWHRLLRRRLHAIVARLHTAAYRVPLILTCGALAATLSADLSNMSRAEVERIWLFLVPWLFVSVVLVPAPVRRWLLPAQLVFGLCLGHIALSAW